MSITTKTDILHRLSTPNLTVLDPTNLIRRLDATSIRVLSIRRVRDPLSGVTRRSLFQHAINLLQAKTLGLRDEEVREENAGSASRAPDEEDLGLEVSVLCVHEVRRDEADDEVPDYLVSRGWE